MAATLYERKDYDSKLEMENIIARIAARARHSPLSAMGIALGPEITNATRAAEDATFLRRIRVAAVRAESLEVEHALSVVSRGLMAEVASPVVGDEEEAIQRTFGGFPWWDCRATFPGTTPMERLAWLEARKYKSIQRPHPLRVPLWWTSCLARTLVFATVEEFFKVVLASFYMGTGFRFVNFRTLEQPVGELRWNPDHPAPMETIVKDRLAVEKYYAVQHHWWTKYVEVSDFESFTELEKLDTTRYEAMDTWRNAFTPLATALPSTDNGWIAHRRKILQCEMDLHRDRKAISFVAAACTFAMVETAIWAWKRKPTWRRLALRLATSLLVHVPLCAFPQWRRTVVHTAINGGIMWLSSDLTCSVVDAVCVAETNHKRVRTQPGYTEQRNATKDAKDEPCTPMFGARMLWGVVDYYADVYRNCVHNEVISLEGRVGKLLPQHSADITGPWVRLYREVRWAFEEIEPVVVPMKFPTWVKTFAPHKRDKFVRMKQEGYELKRQLVCKSFIKQELVLRRSNAFDQHKDPRMIQGCPEEVTLQTGPYVRKLAKHFRSAFKPSKYSMVDDQRKGKHIYYTCGRNANEVGDFFSAAVETIQSQCGPGEYVVVMEDDQSRFDEHMTQETFSFLDRVYRRTMPARIAATLRRGMSKGKTSLGTKYTVPYTMQSGMPDTSCGDSLINAAMKLALHGAGRKWFAIICGDDSVVITTNRELALLGGEDGIKQFYTNLGFEVEVAIRKEYEDTEFCSSRFFPTGDSYVLMPKAGKILGRLGWNRTNHKPGNHLAWGRGVLNTVKNLALVDPVMGWLAEGLSNQLGPGKVILPEHNEYKHTPSEQSVQATQAQTLRYYSRHYELSETELLELKAVLLSVKLGVPISSPIAQRLCEVDSQ